MHEVGRDFIEAANTLTMASVAAATNWVKHRTRFEVLVAAVDETVRELSSAAASSSAAA